MRVVQTRRPSFPEVLPNQLLSPDDRVRWQVMCGDGGHWRVGLYSPAETCPEDIEKLETHDCPELFLLTSGRLSLYMAVDGRLVVVELEAGRPILVTAPHCGFCPDGPHSGVAVVVERDEFESHYWTPEEARRLSRGDDLQGG